MARPPKPTAVLELVGAYKKNPQRKRKNVKQRHSMTSRTLFGQLGSNGCV